MSLGLVLGLEIVFPFIFGILCLCLRGRKTTSLTAISVSGVTTALSILLCLAYFRGGFGKEVTFDVLGFREFKVFSFIVDSASAIIGVIVALIGFLILAFSYDYISPANREHKFESGFGRFYGMMLIFMGSMLGFIYSYSLISMLIFYELTSICSWALIGFFYEEKEAIYAAEKALYITHLGELAFVVSVALVYSSSGGFLLESLSRVSGFTKSLVFVFASIAAWAKSAQLPFWVWLPDAMIAPTPVSAYLHAAAMVKIGPYLLFRFIQYSGSVSYGIAAMIGVMAIITMIYGFLMYIPQADMKRLLAYSTITQLSYMFLSLSFACLGVVDGLRGCIYHIWNHAYAKCLFFLTAGALAYATGSRFLTDYSGIVKKSRIAALSFATAAFAIAGVPPLNCFYSKYLIFLSGFRAHSVLAYALSIIAIGESVLCFIVFLNWVTKCVFGDMSVKIREAQDIPYGMRVVLAILVIACFISAYVIMPFLGRIGFVGGVGR